ncbi:SMP-30/gluconolactonase/LRE family protein [Nitratireductor sp. ZSWI3]|uniref:SMP-30/gluconolactonase/LRE family protein n=1 Tax=Nitratireductor sp. ZSWI3 TaxID=2966359 RepID=UPI002150135D|nr:SMP-30/gluconolactonase/LRE family protein [Nitratireductor sp. ZSWI3]MCR4268564.1 SMP-30/gluconolactonase/LRE family protein [Nitratireductor sp. ZSWI3]
MSTVSIVLESRALLGECPLWSRSRNRLLWVDTLAPTLNLFDPISGENEATAVSAPLGFVAERGSDLFLGLGCDVAKLDNEGTVRKIASAPHAAAGFRLNDARFDVRGRLWIGLMDEALTEGSGRLYRLDPDGSWHEGDSGFTLINGLDWSPDSRTLYVTDSRRGTIYAYDFNPEVGTVSNRRVWFQMNIAEGKPDGLLVDPRGYVLSVLFDGAAVLRLAPDGSLAGRVELPVPRPTSCALSPDRSRLYVTTARLGLSASELEAAPWSGALLALPYPGGTEESYDG